VGWIGHEGRKTRGSRLSDEKTGNAKGFEIKGLVLAVAV
jgi:hypothetical protein